MSSNDPWQIDTPIEDLLIEVEWQGMVEQGGQNNVGEPERR